MLPKVTDIEFQQVSKIQWFV